MKRVVMYSGGLGSWLTAQRVVERHGNTNVVLLFADTRMEDPDLYRFLAEGARALALDGDLVITSEGRTPWQVFHDKRYLGNTRVDPCSRVLKREWLRAWLDEHCQVGETTVYLGMDWMEEHRFVKAARYWAPWRVEAPLCEPPYLHHQDKLDRLQAAGVELPRLYKLGFDHNNCGGFCIKAGQAHFKRLLKTLPERYAFHERCEQDLRDYLGKDVAILRDRRGGGTRPMTLREFRERVDAQLEIDEDEWGGCGCFAPSEDDPDG